MVPQREPVQTGLIKYKMTLSTVSPHTDRTMIEPPLFPLCLTVAITYTLDRLSQVVVVNEI